MFQNRHITVSTHPPGDPVAERSSLETTRFVREILDAATVRSRPQLHDPELDERLNAFVASITGRLREAQWDPAKHPRGGYPQNRGWWSPAAGVDSGDQLPKPLARSPEAPVPTAKPPDVPKVPAPTKPTSKSLPPTRTVQGVVDFFDRIKGKRVEPVEATRQWHDYIDQAERNDQISSRRAAELRNRLPEIGQPLRINELKFARDFQEFEKEHAADKQAREARLQREREQEQREVAERKRLAAQRDGRPEPLEPRLGKFGDIPPSTPSGTASRQPLVKPSGPYRGGRHRDTKKPIGDHLHSHHIPADSINGMHRDDGPAIQMEVADHKETASHSDQGNVGKEYRYKQGQLVREGRFGAAMQMDIDDIRSKFGDKYDGAIREMVKSLDPSMTPGLREPIHEHFSVCAVPWGVADYFSNDTCGSRAGGWISG